jgi:YHS domain-containing protein
MIIDPVCGVQLDDFEYPEREEFNGRMYFFSSLECAQKFRENPEKYVKGREYLGEPVPGSVNVEEPS